MILSHWHILRSAVSEPFRRLLQILFARSYEYIYLLQKDLKCIFCPWCTHSAMPRFGLLSLLALFTYFLTQSDKDLLCIIITCVNITLSVVCLDWLECTYVPRFIPRQKWFERDERGNTNREKKVKWRYRFFYTSRNSDLIVRKWTLRQKEENYPGGTRYIPG